MGKPTICIGENKSADQLSSNCEADQGLCVRYTDDTITLFSKSKIFICDYTGWFVWDLVGTQVVGFLTHMLMYIDKNSTRFPKIVVDLLSYFYSISAYSIAYICNVLDKHVNDLEKT